MKFISAFIAGLLFGAGIAISGMINPAKVLNFFDIAGTFDPSLIFVMGGALVTAAIGYRVIFRTMEKPAFEPEFSLPTRKTVDRSLVAGSITFGIGWGIAGFCPGGSLPALGLGDVRVLIFIAAMAAGLTAGQLYQARST